IGLWSRRIDLWSRRIDLWSRRIGLWSRPVALTFRPAAARRHGLAAALGFYRARSRTPQNRNHPIKSAPRRDDRQGCMQSDQISEFRVKGTSRRASGAQRMRDLRGRNPGYDRRYKAKRRAEFAAWVAALEARKAAAFAEMLPRHTMLLLPAPPVRLALPAPVIDPTLAAINALATKRATQRILQPI